MSARPILFEPLADRRTAERRRRRAEGLCPGVMSTPSRSPSTPAASTLVPSAGPHVVIPCWRGFGRPRRHSSCDCQPARMSRFRVGAASYKRDRARGIAARFACRDSVLVPRWASMAGPKEWLSPVPSAGSHVVISCWRGVGQPGSRPGRRPLRGSRRMSRYRVGGAACVHRPVRRAASDRSGDRRACRHSVWVRRRALVTALGRPLPQAISAGGFACREARCRYAGVAA